jgi:hypothetical protein
LAAAEPLEAGDRFRPASLSLCLGVEHLSRGSLSLESLRDGAEGP